MKRVAFIVINLWSRYQLPLFFIGWCGISFATLTPLEELPLEVPGSDKLHHILGFFGWTLMVAMGNQKTFIYLCVFIFLWGGAIELIQPFVNRYSEWADFIANSIGIAFAYLFITIIKYIIKVRINKPL